MTIFDRVPDDVYIKRLKKSLESRNKVAYLSGLVGVVLLGLGIYYGISIYVEMVKYVGFLEAEDARAMSNSNLAEISVKSNFYFGVGIGAALMAALSAGATLVANVVVLLFGGRKERMLIQYYDNSKRPGA